jgi:hypothetical protein
VVGNDALDGVCAPVTVLGVELLAKLPVLACGDMLVCWSTGNNITLGAYPFGERRPWRDGEEIEIRVWLRTKGLRRKKKKGDDEDEIEWSKY